MKSKVDKSVSKKRKSKGKKGKKSKKVKVKTFGVLSPFILFSKATFKSVKDENPGLALPEISKLLAIKWNAIDDEEKAPYLIQAAEANALLSGKDVEEVDAGDDDDDEEGGEDDDENDEEDDDEEEEDEDEDKADDLFAEDEEPVGSLPTAVANSNEPVSTTEDEKQEEKKAVMDE